VSDDIPVIFNTNAAAAAADVDKLADGIKRATEAEKKAAEQAKASQQLARTRFVALQSVVQAQRKLASDSIAIADAQIKKEQQLARTRFTALQSIVAAQRKFNETQAGSMGAAGGGVSGSKIGGKLAGAAGIGKGWGMGQAVLGAGASLGSLVGVSVAFTAVGIGIGLLADRIGEWINKDEINAKRTEELTTALTDAKGKAGERGLGAAEKSGPTLRMLAATGGGSRELVDQFGGGGGAGGLVGVGSAVMALQGRPEQGAILRQLSIASNMTGISMDDLLEKSKGTSRKKLGGEGGARIFASLGGLKSSSPEEFAEMQKRVGASEEIADLNRIDSLKFQTEQQSIKELPSAVSLLATSLQAMKTAVDSATAALGMHEKAIEAAKEATRQMWLDLGKSEVQLY
jgi:hypothetical protein